MKSKEILKERVKVLRALDTVAKTLNDEYYLENWLIYGVPEDEIDDTTPDSYLLDFVKNDKDWQNLLDLFVKIINCASADGVHATLWTE